MKSVKTKLLAALGAVCVAGTLSWGAGIFQTYPIIGGAAYCASANVSGNAQGGITGQGGTTPSANQTTGTTICGQTVPAGPPALTGTEVFPVDLYTPGTSVQAGGPATADLPVTALGGGYGNTQIFTTTGTTASVAIANGISNFVINTGATTTITSLVLPPNPFQNQQFCVRNVGSVLPAITGTIVSPGSGQSIVGTPATTLGVEVSTGAATYVLTNECFLYNAANTTWYRIT